MLEFGGPINSRLKASPNIPFISARAVHSTRHAVTRIFKFSTLFVEMTAMRQVLHKLMRRVLRKLQREWISFYARIRARMRDRNVMVTFVHHNTSMVFNLGDFLCSPRHYFSFEAVRPVCVIGGGAFNDLATAEARRVKGRTRVSWAIGRTLGFRDAASPPDRAAVFSLFAVASTRDLQEVGETICFVPCVSVLHPLVETKPGTAVGLFLSADDQGASLSSKSILEHQSRVRPDLVLGTNAMSEETFIGAFAKTNEVVTNSYHVAYWSLLSGRSVAVLGYSTKFTSLLEAFGLPSEAVYRYSRGDGEGLARLVEKALDERRFVSLPDYRSVRQEFRAVNLRFAERLVSEGIFTAVIPRFRDLDKPAEQAA